MTYVVHGVDLLPTKIMHAIGTYQPGSIGVSGGYPSNTNQFAIKRATNVRALLAAGALPTDIDDVDGDLEIFADSISRTSQGPDDVYRCIAMGGGGYLDPIERDPERVIADLVNGVVTIEHANAFYGVVVDSTDLRLDDESTRLRRDEIRAERRATAIPVDAARFAPAGA